MEQLNALREALPDAARDIKINLQNVLQPGALNAAQTWGVAAASAYAARNPKLVAAVLADAKAAGVPDETLEDAKAAAIVMGMNNVYYRFRHAIGKETYSQKPARLRMMRITAVTSNKPDFDLFCMAVSAINFCEACMTAHEKEALDGGLSEDQVHDAVRIASVVHGAAVALET
ncbi:MAG: carboxymuconolactone decarboxylase family protein [Archangium sp.]|nr:carboxymuconolactone decarboxylase family protein [Archangium sp.]